MQPDPPKTDEDDALLSALGDLFRAQEAAADAAWPSADPALRPIDDPEAAALFERVQAQVGGASASATEAKVIPFPRRRVVGAVLALAAGLLLFVFTRGPSGPPPLPEYSLSALTGDQEVRNGEPKEKPAAERADYTPGSRVLLVARPAQQAQAGVSAHAFVEQGGALTPVALPIQISAAGALRFDGVAGDSVPMQPGDGRLIIMVVPAGLDTPPAALAQAADPSPARRLVQPFRFQK